jgi:hypothetical protein
MDEFIALGIIRTSGNMVRDSGLSEYISHMNKNTWLKLKVAQ